MPWVLWDSPVDTFSMLRPRNEPLELRRNPSAVPSRAADNVFWLGRYVERAENVARLARTLVTRVRRAEGAEHWVPGAPAQLCLISRATGMPSLPNGARETEAAHGFQELRRAGAYLAADDSKAKTGQPHFPASPRSRIAWAAMSVSGSPPT